MDCFGGLRQYASDDSTSFANIESDRIWIYGTKCGWHGTFKITFGSHEWISSEKLELNGGRKDWKLVFDTDMFQFTSDNFVITAQETITINCIYYLNDPPPATPSSSPTASDTPSLSQTPTSTTSLSPSLSPSPSFSPSFSPSISATIIPMPTDEPTPENLTNDGSIDKVFQILSLYMIKVKISDSENGGAIHIINSGLQCQEVSFHNCTSADAGSGIYVNNKNHLNNSIVLEHLIFENCLLQSGIFLRKRK